MTYMHLVKNYCVSCGTTLMKRESRYEKRGNYCSSCDKRFEDLSRLKLEEGYEEDILVLILKEGYDPNNRARNNIREDV